MSESGLHLYESDLCLERAFLVHRRLNSHFILQNFLFICRVLTCFYGSVNRGRLWLGVFNYGDFS